MADTASVLTGGTNSYATTSEDINALATDILSQGVVGTIGNTSGVSPATGALAVNAQGSPNMTVAITAGKAWVTVTPTSQGSQKLRANIAAQNATIAANSTGGTRYDWIYVAMSASGAANPAVDGTGVASITVSRSTSISTDNGTPPTYGYNIAKVTVSNGASSITNGNIADMRSAITVASNSAADGWITAEATPATVTGLGNRSYSLVFSSVDMTDTISPGMRLKMTRTVTAPTQCTDLEASSSQYFNKTSPSGMTFTDDFVASAWIKLESYPTVNSPIMSRFNGTSGWSFNISTSGYIQLIAYNGGAGNTSQVRSYRSIPLGRWVHVAAQLDMSAFTATTTTSYTMIDGLDCPAVIARSGTNPTALIQAGDFQIGKDNTTNYFDGKIAQAAIYSAKVTQATILASMDRTLAGNETSLISAYSFNNSINDLSATANNLTANGGAVATNADSPFAQDSQGVPTGTTEYGVVTKTAFSTNTTVTVQVPEGGAIPTSGGVSAVSYSTHRTPYGFPAQKSKWRLDCFLYSASTASNATHGTFEGGGFQIVVPVGSWNIGWQAQVFNSTTTVVVFNLSPIALTGLTSTAGAAISHYGYRAYSPTGTVTSNAHISSTQNVTTQVAYIMYTVGATTSAGFDTDGVNEVFAECDYV